MSFSRYNVEKKQISTDRGVHWVDVEPAETQKGALVGVARTLLECEDMACELEEDRYTLIDGELPEEFCGEFYIPEGVIKYYTFTAGALCCDVWVDSSVQTYDFIYDEYLTSGTGHRVCGGGYCPGWDYNSNVLQNGRDLRSICKDIACYQSPYKLCPCITIDEFMPWAKGKTTWKLIQKQHYSRPHCSDEWEADGEPEIIGIGERWKFITDDFYSETWQHQVAEAFDTSGNVTSWVSSGSPEITYFDSTLPVDVELVPSIELNGNLYSTDNSLYKSIGAIQMKRSAGGESPSGTVLSSVYHYGCSYTGCHSNAQLAASGADLTNEFKYIKNDVYAAGSHSSSDYYRRYGSFCYVNMSGMASYGFTTSVSDYLSGATAGIIRTSANSTGIVQNKSGTLFPYRKSTSEYGFITRDGFTYPLSMVQ